MTPGEVLEATVAELHYRGVRSKKCAYAPHRFGGWKRNGEGWTRQCRRRACTISQNCPYPLSRHAVEVAFP